MYSQKNNLDVSNSRIIFKETPQGKSTKEFLVLRNIGVDKVNIEDVVIADTSNFKLLESPETSILPGDSIRIEVLFKPKYKIKDNSTMLIYTYDNKKDSVSIDLEGKGIYPPKIKINIPDRR